LYQDLEWSIPVSGPELFITFDDGPIPEITPRVLEILKAYNAKATFFCIGENVRKHPEIYRQILEEGHRTGNHTQHHINGWKTNKINYLRQSLLCSHYVQSDLFRPPYGRISRAQAKALKSRFRIIMWDVLSMDYDKRISREKCLDNVVKNAGPGSIIVFHDSHKAADNMLHALPAMLDHFSKKGFRFNAIP